MGIQTQMLQVKVLQQGVSCFPLADELICQLPPKYLFIERIKRSKGSQIQFSFVLYNKHRRTDGRNSIYCTSGGHKPNNKEWFITKGVIMAPVLYRFLGPLLLLVVQSRCQHNNVTETVPDICNVSRCKHGGTCISYGDMYMCKCPPGYDGVMCEKDIDPCLPNPCKHSGECILSKDDSFVCKCKAGYSGSTCDMSPCDKQCSMVYSPVCGSDMYTYISECQLQRTVCNKPWLKVIDNNPCKSVGCKTLCAPTEKPVCGTNCITYENECELDNDRRCAAQQFPQLTKSYNGDCRAFSCEIRRPYKCSKCLLLTGRVCGSDGKRYKSECHLLLKACTKPDLKLVKCPRRKPKGNCTIPIDLANAEVADWYPGDVVPQGTRLVFSCKKGYAMKGNAKVKCKGKPIVPPKCYANCNEITVFDNGGFRGSSTHGKEYTFWCDVGYSLIGKSSIKCSNGDYSSSIPDCRANCQPVTSFLNGRYTGNSEHGLGYSFSCDKGYSLIGDGNVNCRDGKYSSPIPECKADCLDLKTLANGRIIPAITHGEEALFICYKGYTLVGVNKTRCIDGSYTDKIPTCAENCAEAVVPLNGLAVGDSYHGAKVTFTCQPGFTLDGVNSTTCINGRYEHESPRCRSLCDDKIEVVGGTYSGSVNHGQTIHIQCNTGYTLEGDGIVACNMNGRLNSSLEVCKAKCQRPNLANGYVSGDPVHGEQITYTCIEGFTMQGSSTTTCNDGNYEDRSPVCQAKCQLPNLANGDVSGGDVSGDSVHGGQITYTCNEGFTLEGSNTTTCNDGNYQDPPPLCRAKCDSSTVIPFGNYTGSLIHGTSIQVTCHLGYKLVGDGEIMCKDGQFTSNLNVCKASCSPPFSFTNGEMTGDFSHGGHIVFGCDPGYKLDGASSTTCVDGSLQDPVPTCLALCTPDSPANGTVTGDFTHGGQVQFSCFTGFALDGVNMTTCDNGNLKDPVPFCRAKCPELSAPENGILETFDNIHDGITTFKCLDGFTLDGAETLKCIGGHYDNKQPTCASGCTPPNPPVNGYITPGSSYGHGDTVFFKCDRDYSLVGAKKDTCKDGQYKYDAPICKKKCPRQKEFPKGEINSNRGHLGVTTFKCYEGFTLVGVNETKCFNGEYQDETPICHENCKPPDDIEHGSYSGELTHGGVITYSCSIGRSVIGNSQRNCSDGILSGTDPECRKMCAEFDFPNGVVTGERVHNASLTFSCDENYILEGQSSMLCIDGVYNDNIPRCVAPNQRLILKQDSCKELKMEHGTVTGDFTHNSKVRFTCFEGYKLVGTPEITCLGGIYASEAPTCLKNCEDPGTPIDGSKTFANFDHGEKVTFECIADFTLVGNKTIVCKDGSWSNAIPSCSPCSDGQTFYNGTCFSKHFERLEILSAKQSCKLKGGHLATYTTREELMNVTTNIGGYYAIGIEASGNDWKQVTSETSDFVNWAPLNCVYLSQTRGYRWSNSNPCTQKMQYICEYSYTRSIPSPCVLNSVNYNGHSYTAMGFGNRKTWREARDACTEDNGQLIVIDNYQEQDRINSFLKECGPYESDSFWIGLIREDSNSEWGWINNSPLTFNFWPDFQCAFLSDDEDRHWYTAPCENGELMYICERGGAVSPRYSNPCDSNPCLNDGTCIPKVTEDFSDYYCICETGRDGRNCQNRENCSGFTCDDGTCIQRLFRCDSTFNCRDKSDERNCGRGDFG
ncbi:sushi, von Willebrand factor type A, EGF and pentraxin domain-containing protein 1-like isoform X2 [Anneissia japonica]|uniref:sushi, von Willebrand factor type A, EGF and pentraxin domain-containing protein 1-like isoform X2 n=1 Tax=Anneissia japonica TaxID=1529436 RepID=UPI0014254E18|nr:sushi, von Willebrand factor type A, EGF and pentraxin domain-containing protein 1-like isoform X2 [Anneissia japonica]